MIAQIQERVRQAAIAITHRVTTAVVWVVRQATTDVPWEMSGTALYLLFGFILAGFALLNNFPMKAVPTEAVGLLAAAAVVVTIRTDQLTRSEKVGWIVVAFFMFFIEMRIVTNDRAEQQAAFAEARTEESFAFRRSLMDSQIKFEATMRGLEAIISDNTAMLGTQNQNLIQTIGGTSYPIFVATFPVHPADTMWPVHVVTPGKPWKNGHTPTYLERAPLRDVTVDIFEYPRIDKKLEFSWDQVEAMLNPIHYNLGTMVVPGMFTAPFKLQGGKRYILIITTQRGLWRERIYLDRDESAPNGWRLSMCMYGTRIIQRHGSTVHAEILLSGKCD